MEKTRFVCEGRGLGYWLWELVCDDMDRRDRAAEAIGRMHLEFPDDLADLEQFDAAAHQEEFFAQVRRTVAGADFDGPRYLEALVGLMQTAQTRRMALSDEENERQDRILDKLIARLGPQPRPHDVAALIPRLCKVICAGCDSVSARTQDRLVRQQVSAGLIFGALGEQLLLVSDALRSTLWSDHRYEALAALERIGPAANGFAPALLHELDACTDDRCYDAARALASIIREDPATVRGVVARLAPERSVAAGAADTLACLGPAAARLAPDCVPALLRMAQHADSGRRAAAASALGRVTTGTDIAVDRLLDLTYDTQSWVRGVALSALGDVARQPERVVPRLIAAFDDYREQDPDLCYGGAHERVVGALQAFGDAAAPAVPALIARVRNPDGELDRGVLQTLAKLASAARAALPILEKLAQDLGYTPEDLQDRHDPLAAAIARIAGTPEP